MRKQACSQSKYFHIIKKPSSSENNLPDSNGPLSRVIPSSTIAAANEKVCAIDKMPGAASREPYLHLTGVQKYQVGKGAAGLTPFGITPCSATRDILRELYM